MQTRHRNTFTTIRTRQVETRTTLLLRYYLLTTRGDLESPLLAEEVLPMAFTGSPDRAEWLDADAAEKLVNIQPDANIHPQQASRFIQTVIEGFTTIQPQLEAAAVQRAEVLLDSHRRVRDASRHRGRYRVEPQLPPEILGIYVFLPVV